MSAPMVQVIFKDADGDEFPIAVSADLKFAARKTVARERIDEIVAEGSYRPTGTLTYDREETL